jgi:hypothetical protein
MRKTLVGVGLLLVLLCVTDVAADSYRVILKNGSWVQAREKPAPDGSNMRIRLLGGGVAVVPEGSIDWDATQRRNKPGDAPAAKPTAEDARATAQAPSGTITMVGDPKKGDSQAAAAQPSGDAPAAANPPAASEAPASLLGQKRQRYQQLELQLSRLRTQKGELERRAHSSVNLDSARDLRSQAADLETRIQAILAEQKTLLIEGNAATANTGDDQELNRRLRFLNTTIPKLRTEKMQLEQQAHNSISLDDAKVLRNKADALFTRIQALEAERDRLNLRQSQRQP